MKTHFSALASSLDRSKSGICTKTVLPKTLRGRIDINLLLGKNCLRQCIGVLWLKIREGTLLIRYVLLEQHPPTDILGHALKA